MLIEEVENIHGWAYLGAYLSVFVPSTCLLTCLLDCGISNGHLLQLITHYQLEQRDGIQDRYWKGTTRKESGHEQ